MATFTPIPGTAQPAPPGPNVGDYLAMFGTGLLGGQQQKQGLERETAEAEKKRQANLLLALAQTKQLQPSTGAPGEQIVGSQGGINYVYNSNHTPVTARQKINQLTLQDMEAERAIIKDPIVRRIRKIYEARVQQYSKMLPELRELYPRLGTWKEFLDEQYEGLTGKKYSEGLTAPTTQEQIAPPTQEQIDDIWGAE